MLTQEQCGEEEGGAEGRAGEAAKGEEEEDDVMKTMMTRTQKRDT